MYIYKATLRGPLNLTDSCRFIFLPASDRLSPVRPGLAELSVIGPWLAPLCPAINPNPLALGTVGQGSLPNPSPLLPSTLQLEHAKLSSTPPPPPPAAQLTTTYFTQPITHHPLQIKYTYAILLPICVSRISTLRSAFTPLNLHSPCQYKKCSVKG